VLLMINTGLAMPGGTSGRVVIWNMVLYEASATEMQLTNGVDLYANQGAATMQSTLAGNDTIDAAGGNDTLIGGSATKQPHEPKKRRTQGFMSF
jgi:hypothetical protein